MENCFYLNHKTLAGDFKLYLFQLQQNLFLIKTVLNDF